MYYNKRIINSTNKTKSTWKIINYLLGKQHSSNDIQKLTIEDKHFTNQNDIANLLNQHFSTVVDKLNCNNENNESYNNFSTCLPNKGIQDQFPSVVFKSFSTHEIINIIKSLKTKESYGHDEISTKLLKISANYICSPLTHICNKAIAAGIFPQRLKYSIIKPLFKKGDKTKPSNYRPISLLTTFSKVLEKALFNRLIEHIEKNNILSKQQFGFRKRYATEDAIFRLTHEILSALNENEKVCGIFCDLEKAFDAVKHSVLIKKLSNYGIVGKAKLIMESYITNRYHRVETYNSTTNTKYTSTWTRMKYGVPQGSILGPLLFLLYINDLPNSITLAANTVLFADDTSLIISRPNMELLQNDLIIIFQQIAHWFQQNSLFLNFEKTNLIQFFNKKQNDSTLNIIHNGSSVPKINEVKFLGLSINKTLSWITHIDTILPKLSSACYAMMSIKPYLSQQILKVVYYSYFHSIMSYGIIFWGHTTNTIRVFRLQKRILRIMTGCGRRDSCRKLFVELKILTLPSLYIYQLIMFVNKNNELYVTNDAIHNYSTRQNKNLHQPAANLTNIKMECYIKELKCTITFPHT